MEWCHKHFGCSLCSYWDIAEKGKETVGHTSVDLGGNFREQFLIYQCSTIQALRD